MTVIEATRKLIDFFSTNDIYLVKDNFTSIVPISLEEEIDKAIISIALEDLVKQDLVKPIYKQNKAIAYVLTKPLVEYSQTVQLSFQFLSALTSTVNDFCDSLNLQHGKVNPLSVTEADLGSLIIIIQTLKAQLEKNG